MWYFVRSGPPRWWPPLLPKGGGAVGTQVHARVHCGMLRGFPNVRRWADTDDVLQSALMRLLHTLQATRPEDTRHFADLAALRSTTAGRRRRSPSCSAWTSAPSGGAGARRRCG